MSGALSKTVSVLLHLRLLLLKFCVAGDQLLRECFATLLLLAGGVNFST